MLCTTAINTSNTIRTQTGAADDVDGHLVGAEKVSQLVEELLLDRLAGGNNCNL